MAAVSRMLGAGLHVEGASTDSGRVSLGDIESRLRALTGTAAGAISRSKTTAGASAALAGVVVIAAAYLHGRRRGRRRATVLEIRRV